MNIAALQMTSSNSIQENLTKIETILNEWDGTKIDVLVLPENFCMMAKSTSQKLEVQEKHEDGPVQNWLSSISEKYNLCLIAGSFPISSNIIDKPYARCLVYGRDGKLKTYYDKIHLFDVSVSNLESYKESKDNLAGNTPVMFDFEGFKIGLSICYDLRFPELYRFYQQQGVDVIVAPSAFTYATGEKHWDVLLKARAIENLSYVIAPNQTGMHKNGRRTYGHSQIVSPWGESLALINKAEGLICHKLSKRVLSEVRMSFPALQHRKI